MPTLKKAGYSLNGIGYDFFAHVHDSVEHMSAPSAMSPALVAAVKI